MNRLNHNGGCSGKQNSRERLHADLVGVAAWKHGELGKCRAHGNGRCIAADSCAPGCCLGVPAQPRQSSDTSTSSPPTGIILFPVQRLPCREGCCRQPACCCLLGFFAEWCIQKSRTLWPKRNSLQGSKSNLCLSMRDALRPSQPLVEKSSTAVKPITLFHHPLPQSTADGLTAILRRRPSQARLSAYQSGEKG